MRKIWLGLLALGASFFFFGCGTQAKDLCQGTDCKGKRWQERNQAQCGGRAVGNFHEVTVRLPAALPAHLAVEVEGKRRFDECNTPAQEAPYVSALRGTDNRLVVRVEHGGAYPKLPTQVSLRVLDLKGCAAGAPAEALFAISNLTLDFKDETVNGPSCPPVKVARVTVQKTN